MKPGQVMVGLLIGASLGFIAGWLLARGQARLAVISGPYSDNYGPVIIAIAEAREKLQSGDMNVVQHLGAAQAQIEQAPQWTK